MSYPSRASGLAQLEPQCWLSESENDIVSIGDALAGVQFNIAISAMRAFLRGPDGQMGGPTKDNSILVRGLVANP